MSGLANYCIYITLVRSQLTYCSAIWRPHLLKDIALFEIVQKRATKWILEDYTSDYKTKLVTLQLLPLMMTYELNDLSFFLKALQSPSQSFDILDYVSFCSSSTRLNGTKLKHHSCHGSKHFHFYFNRLPQLWNSLPPPDSNLSRSQVLLFSETF